MKIKMITCLMLAAFVQCCFGQTDTNVLAVGDWSAPLKDSFLRGRLLVYDAEDSKGDGWEHGRIYLELQNVQKVGGPSLEFYFDGHKSCLHFEMRDGHDKLIALSKGSYAGPVPDPFTMTLPPESTLRVRVDFDCQSTAKPNGLKLSVSGMESWTIRPDSTNDYYLSATFSPPTNHPSALNSYVWQGTLQLPKVKIPTEKIKKR